MEKHILVVDDEPSIRESISEFLEDFNYQVTSAESAEEGLEIVEQKHFDAVIADLRLGGMNGDMMIPLAAKIQPQLRFLIHTGSAGYHIPQELQELGMTDSNVLFKPLNDLMVLVNNLETIISTAQSSQSPS